MAPYGIREIVVEDLNGYRLAFGELQHQRPHREPTGA
jgi:hypothetical protein